MTKQNKLETIEYYGNSGEVTFGLFYMGGYSKKTFVIKNKRAGSSGILSVVADTQLILQTTKVTWKKSEEIVVEVANNRPADEAVNSLIISFMSFN